MRGLIVFICLFSAAAAPLYGQACTAVAISPSANTFTASGGVGTFAATGNPTNCNRTATSPVDWITLTFGGGTANPVTFGYTVQQNTSVTPRSGSVVVNGGLATFTISQAGASCIFTLSPTSASIPAAGSNGNFSVTTTSICSWTARANASWITITSDPGIGNGSVGFFVEANNTGPARSGTISVGSSTFTVNQAAGCSFSLNPNAVSLGSQSGQGTVSITASTGSCARQAASDSDWLTVVSGGIGTGSGTLAYAVAANNSTSSRTGRITVGSAVLTVTQGAAACAYSFSPSSASLPGSGGNGVTQLSAGSPDCAWTAVPSDPWISLLSAASGTGSASLSYNVAPNSAAGTRSGSIGVGGALFTINQSAACSFTLSPNTVTVPSTTSSGTASITANLGSCTRTATSDSAWLTVTSGQSGTGNGTVAYAVAANNTPQSRTGTISVGDAQLRVIQLAGNCLYNIAPNTRSLTSAGGSGTFSLTTGCTWTATSSADWLSAQPASGTGNTTVAYSVAPNSSVSARTATLTIGSAIFTATQDGAACAVSLSSTSADAPVEGLTGTLEVTASPSCTWNAAANVPWISVTSGSTGNGDGAVTFAVAANTGPTVRTGALVIGTQLFTIAQRGATCTLAVTPAAFTAQAPGMNGSIQVISNCDWTAASGATWITFASAATGSGNGQVDFSVAANASAQARSGSIRIGSATVSVTQSGGVCSISLAPLTAEYDGGENSGRIVISGSPGCTWQASSNAPWLAITGQSSLSSGSGSVDYRAAANRTFDARTGVITVASQTFSVTQAGSKPAIATGGIMNGASFKSGPLSPGEIISIFGFLLGPEELATARLTPDGQFLTKELVGTRVLFDGQPAAMVFSRFDQLNAVVPYGVAGRPGTKVQVEYQGVLSNEVTMPVAAVSPAMFAADSTGTGQGAILNQDSTVNSETNPAARNTVIMIFATGEGLTNPAGSDGKLAVPPLPAPRVAVTVRIGGQIATLRYSGAAPGLVAGGWQINALIPATNIQPGAKVPVSLTIGGVESPAGITVAVK